MRFSVNCKTAGQFVELIELNVKLKFITDKLCSDYMQSRLRVQGQCVIDTQNVCVRVEDVCMGKVCITLANAFIKTMWILVNLGWFFL